MNNPKSARRSSAIARSLLALTLGWGPLQSIVAQSHDNALHDTDVSVGHWVEVGRMQDGRYGHTATQLLTGKVLVVGGTNDSETLDGAEIYDPETRTWSGVDWLDDSRGYHTATLLPNGKVLVAGGLDRIEGWRSSAELFDPATGTWSRTGDMARAEAFHEAVLLPDGRVLVAGGWDPRLSQRRRPAQIYDPASGTWSATGAVQFGAGRVLTVLPDGDVLATGGDHDPFFTPQLVPTTERFDQESGAWSQVAPLPQSRAAHSATLLRDGRVLVCGGYGQIDGAFSALASSQLFDPLSGTWHAAAELPDSRYDHTATLLDSGEVLVVGGQSFERTTDGGTSVWRTAANLYDAANDTWRSAGGLGVPRYDHTATFLATGEVLVVGGKSYDPLSTYVRRTELYRTANAIDERTTGTWYDPAQPGHGLFIQVLPEGRFLAWWFAFDPAGTQQAWFGGVGTYNGATATIPQVTQGSGGRWIPNFNSAQVVNNPWGSLSLEFSDLDHGRVEFSSIAGYGSGSMNLTRLTRPAAPATDASGGGTTAIGPAFTGAWFDPAQAGHGLFVEVLPDNRVMAWWFSFDPSGTQQAWFGGVGTYSGNTATISNVVQPTGGRWIPNFNPQQVANNPWGTLTLTFSDCAHGTAQFSSTRGYGSGTMNLARLTVPTGLACP